jgi:hypothetical protein
MYILININITYIYIDRWSLRIQRGLEQALQGDIYPNFDHVHTVGIVKRKGGGPKYIR